MLFPPDRQHRIRTEIIVRVTAKRNRNPVRHRSYPRVVKRARHNSYPVKRECHNGTRYSGAAVIRLANQTFTTLDPGKPLVTALQTAS